MYKLRLHIYTMYRCCSDCDSIEVDDWAYVKSYNHINNPMAMDIHWLLKSTMSATLGCEI